MAHLNSERLIVMLKAPRPGTVKTRLGMAPAVAAAAYRRLAEAVFAQVGACPGVELRFTPADAEPEIRPWIKAGWRAEPQCEGDLGERLSDAFASHFGSGAERVVIIGADCPYVTTEDIQTAWRHLRSCDVVLGPAEDGGYWLIGLRQPRPELFDGIPWSSERVLSETLARAKALGLTTHLLRTLGDVDTREDWERFILAATPAPPPRQSPAAD